VLAAIALVLGCSVDAANTGPEPEPTPEPAAMFSANGLTFEHPASWGVDDDWGLWHLDTATVELELSDDALFLVLLWARDVDEVLDDPLEAYAWDPSERSESKLAGFDVAEGAHTVEILDIEVELEVIAGVQRFGDHQVIVQLSSPADEFEDHRPGFEQVLSTLELNATS